MPSAPSTVNVMFYAIAISVGIGALCMLIWALFRDGGRLRAPFRCPRCWYDLTPRYPGTAPALPITCPECGRTTVSLKRLRKRKRRWSFALCSLLLMLLAGVIACYPHAHRSGWLSIVPTRFLIDSMPVFGYPCALTDELVRRTGMAPGQAYRSDARQISIEDRTYLAHRIASGNALAPPMSDLWKRTFGEFQSDFRNSLFCLKQAGSSLTRDYEVTDARLAAAIRELRDLEPEIVIRTRPVWPEGVPLYVETRLRTWWPADFIARAGLHDKRTDRWHDFQFGPPFTVVDLCPSSGSLDFEVRVDWDQHQERSFEWKELTSFSRTLPYRIQGRIDEILTPVVDPAIDKLVASLPLVSGMGAKCDITQTCTKRTRGIAFGVLIEYTHSGVVKGVERVWWSGSSTTRTKWVGPQREWIVAPPDDFYNYAGDHPWHARSGEHWAVRIRSDPETALRVIDADRYWQGDVTLHMTIP